MDCIIELDICGVQHRQMQLDLVYHKLPGNPIKHINNIKLRNISDKCGLQVTHLHYTLYIQLLQQKSINYVL